MVNVTYNTTLRDFNPQSFSDLLVYAGTVVDGFWSIVLTGIFFIMMFVLYNTQLYRNGRGDILATATVSAWFVTVLGYVMSLIPGMISKTPILFSLTGSIVLTIILFLTPRNEQ